MIEVFYVPCPDHGTAVKLVSHLIALKLIACGNITSADSLYEWEGRTAHEKEHIAIMKSVPSLTGKIEDVIKSIHPYSIPAIIRWPVNCNREYFRWVCDQLGTGVAD